MYFLILHSVSIWETEQYKIVGIHGGQFNLLVCFGVVYSRHYIPAFRRNYLHLQAFCQNLEEEHHQDNTESQGSNLLAKYSTK
jgi:hypothetical protein